MSDVRSRSAGRTANAFDTEIDADDRAAVQAAQERLTATPLICLDRKLGRGPEFSFTCRLLVPVAYARIALSWATLFEPAGPGASPDFVTVQLPEWTDLRIRVFPEAGVTYVLGSDYTGEAKKSFLRLFMHEIKGAGGLGLHAGAKRIHLEESDEPIGQLFLGLSATGKTTLTCHDFGLQDGERAELIQDDVCGLLPDGRVIGSEGAGLFIKTAGLSADSHAQLHEAATSPNAVLENVAVDQAGQVDFSDDSITANGRASVRREDLPIAASEIDLDRVDHINFITRNPLMPPLARLDSRAAAAAFMLGESVESSAGDPSQAGEPVRVVGTNPFIIGSPGEEGNRFLDLIEANDIDCFLVNTGQVGEANPAEIRVDDTVALLRAVARAAIRWVDDSRVGLTIPDTVPGIDLERFYPPDRVQEYEARTAALRRERREYLEQFDELQTEIRESGLTTPRPSASMD